MTIIFALLGVLYIQALCGHVITVYLSDVIARTRNVPFWTASTTKCARILHSRVCH